MLTKYEIFETFHPVTEILSSLEKKKSNYKSAYLNTGDNANCIAVFVQANISITKLFTLKSWSDWDAITGLNMFWLHSLFIYLFIY